MKKINPEELVRGFVKDCDKSLQTGDHILGFFMMEYEDQKKFLSVIAAYIMGLKQRIKND